MAVALQLLNKVLQTHDFSVLEDNDITPDYFIFYEDEANFIYDHYNKYGTVPDKETFLYHFTKNNNNYTFDFIEVQESDKYLIDTIREEYLYDKTVKLIQGEYNSHLKGDSLSANEFLLNELNKLQPNYNSGGIDIISQSKARFNEYKERKENQDKWFFESGFEELDEITHGIQRGEELYVIIARTNQGKSWILEKMCTHVWQTGFNVGYVSPEMSASSIGFRFDTLFKNYSNKDLMWGKGEIDASYEEYINELSTRENKFMVATPLDFDRKITVSKLKNWIKRNKLDMIAIDGITYMTDERGGRNDNKTTTLTNISEDLMSLSVEMKVPVLVVVQVNRSGVAQDAEGTPELESIRDSDGIAFNASKVISIRQKQDSVLEIGIKKQRNGAVGGKLNYLWDINTGTFTYSPSYSSPQSTDITERRVSESKDRFKHDAKDIF